MAGQRLHDALRNFQRLLSGGPTGEGTDRQLLERFARQRDEAAFASLVRRHGALVLGVGRRILHHDQDAEDVFQATFLILARKATSSRWQNSIAGWLSCVAHRLAIRTRAKTFRQRQREHEAGTAAAAQAPTLEDRGELYTIVEGELHRLADRYREPLLLCYLEAKTRDQAARQLGWSLRTLERRLEQGLKLLRARLGRRGVELPVALLVAGLSQQTASAHVSAALVMRTVEAATAGGVVSSQVAALAEGALKAMAMTKLKLGAAASLALSLLAFGAVAFGYWLPGTEQAAAYLAVEEQGARVPQATDWPEGAIVHGRVVDQRGTAVANAEVLLLGKERIIVDADRRTWFVSDTPNDRSALTSAKTNAKGEFTIERKKGPADRLAIIADDPFLWVVFLKSLAAGDNVEIKLPPAGSLAIHCDLPGKDPKQPVSIELRTFDGVDWTPDVLRFHSGSFSVKNPGETVFEHLPPGQYTVDRYSYTPIGKRAKLMTATDRQLLKVESGKRAVGRFERKVGRPVTGQIRGLENVELLYAHVSIMYAGPEEPLGPDGKLGRMFTAFDVIPINSDGKFTTDPIPPGEYHLSLFAVRASTLEQSRQSSDFHGPLRFIVPERGEMPKVDVVARPSTPRERGPNTDYRMSVVDETGKPLPKFQAMLHTADAGYDGWLDGRDGLVGLGSPRMYRDANAVDVLVRAFGYASAVARFEGDQRKKLQGEATMTLQRGRKAELQFRLPEGLTWPEGVLPEVYFSDYQERVRPMRQPVNRQRGNASDFNMLNVRTAGAGRFEFQLAPDTPPFHVAIHAPGFLQHFEAGPFTLASAKQGALEIEVPRPASLDIRFDPAADNPDAVPFKGVTFQVLRQIQGNSYLEVARDAAASINHQLKLNDLSPGVYQVRVDTQPKPETKPEAGAAINPGAYHDQQQVVLKAGKSEPVNFRYAPFDPNAFRGQRTAVLRIRLPDGTPAAGRELTVGYQAGHYGYLVVFKGQIPNTGEVAVKGLTDRLPSFCPPQLAYAVTVDQKRLGTFGFTKAEPTQEFEFSLAPGIGDPAPDVELMNVATGKRLRLSSLRGKVVCLEFWATWCGPCQPAMAKLNGLSAEQSAAWKDRVAIIPVSIDAARDRVQPHVLRQGWNRLDHFWTGDGSGSDFDAPAARAFVVFGVPEAILIDPEGRILWRGHPEDKSEGQTLKSRIEAELKK